MNTNPVAVIIALFFAVVFIGYAVGFVVDTLHRMGL